MKYFPISVEVDGHRYTGDWSLMQGGRICVRSLGFGSEAADLGDENPDRLAHQVLEQLVRKDQQNREVRASLQKREAARLRRKRLAADRRLAAQLDGAEDPMIEALARLVGQIEGGGYRDQHGQSLEMNECFLEVRELLRGYGA